MVTVNELITAVVSALDGCRLSILAPTEGLVVLAGTVAATIKLPADADLDSFVVTLDEVDVTDAFDVDVDPAQGVLTVAAGEHRLQATVMAGEEIQSVSVAFEAIELTNPDECEILNDAECLLPYPSSRFLVEDRTTTTGFRLQIPVAGLPEVNGPPLDPSPVNELDGFSPTVQILMHFSQGVDLERSDASRLLAPGCCGQPAGPPWIDTRTYDGRSLDADSPSVLIDADTGDRVLHWLELDARAAGSIARQALVMRPGASLIPGHRYIVAMRSLKTASGEDVVAERAFAAFRDRLPSTIDAIETRRAAMEDIFTVLAEHDIARQDLVLAFDFTVQSDAQLTSFMRVMRDESYEWLDTVEADPEEITFTVTGVTEHDCDVPGTATWRDVVGTYKVPLYLTVDPNVGVGFPSRDENRQPLQNGFTDASFGIAIPCSLLRENPPTAHPIVLGHGLFGRGTDMTTFIPPLANAVVPWTAIAGATDWRGLSGLDLGFVVGDVIGVGESKLNNFPAFTGRLKQGMLNTLVLARMMKRGLFNRNTETFRTPDGRPVFPGDDTEMFYYGISLGGIMGTWFSALTPDVERFGVDVPAINFSCLLQRSTQFGPFDQLLAGLGLTDPMQVILGVQILHELWVASEPAGYARHITSDPLPGSGDPKRILMTPAWLDKQVSNQCSEAAARTMQLPNLVPGSIQRALQGIEDREGPLDSAYVMWDPGAFDIFNPAHQPFIPPLANVIPSDVCDPHGDRPRIPASIRQLAQFLQPGGQVVNTCNGLCDGGEPDEIAGGAAESCDPLAQ
jgi:hypothetical protein